MGHHYVPQAYLRSFETEPNSGVVWMFDKLLGAAKQIPIRAAAQEQDYYDQDVERQLSAIEGPAHAALARVLSSHRVDESDRLVLAYYVAVMMYRVPHRRRKSEEMVQGVVESTIASVRRELESLGASRPANDPVVQRRLEELDRLAEKYRSEPPASVRDQLRAPWPSEQVFRIVAQKTWRLVFAIGQDEFVTSDNPAFFFEGYGLGNPASELTFPLSPELALLADWQGQPFSVTCHNVRPSIVREVNRRVVSGSERFIFSRAPEEWLPKVAAKRRPYLSRIDWSGRQRR